MKVCYITHASNLTGASQSLLDLLSEINRSDVSPIVLLGRHGPLEDELKARNVPYKLIWYAHDIRSNNPVKNLAKRIVNRIATLRIRRFLKAENVDLVHNNSFLVRVGMEAAYRARIPYICHNREMVWEGLHVRLLSQKRQYFLLQNSACAIEISNAVHEYYSRLVPDATYRVLSDGICKERYSLDRGAILQGETVELLMAGRIEPPKGQLIAIKAIELLNGRTTEKLHLTIVGSVGDPSYLKAVQDYIAEKSLSNISLLSFSDLEQMRRNCDIVLVCSVAEGLGRVTVEGMLAGCLVVGAASGATTELITHNETGLLFETDNPADLADKIALALSSPKAMNAIAQNGRRWADAHFDISEYCTELVSIYNEILGKCHNER